MRIGRWSHGGATYEGVITDEAVLPFDGGRTVRDVLAAGMDAAASPSVEEGHPGARPRGAVRLLAPLTPASVRDFVAFEEHVEGVTASVDGASAVVDEWYTHPTFYFANPHTVVGPDAVIEPPATRRLDFELEVAAVVCADPGSLGSDLTPEAATRHLFGYTIMNDWSARDLQGREMKVRLGPCKGKDFATTLGPWIVTADELEPFVDADGFLAVRAEAYVNGALVGEDLVSNMGWPFPELLAYAARDARIAPGDVLGSGTVGNGGCLAELWGRGGALEPPPLAEGDEVRLAVEGIGEITNTVGAAHRPTDFPPARPRPRARRR